MLPKLARVASAMPQDRAQRALPGGRRDRRRSRRRCRSSPPGPSDGGPYITLPMVITRDPDKGTRNVGCYRMQVYDRATTGMHWQLHKTGRRHMRRYKELGQQRMPVAVALGGDPVLPYAATAPLPDGIDEFLFAGFLRRKPVEMVPLQDHRPGGAGVGRLRAGRLRRRRRAAPRRAVRRPHRLLLAGRRLPGLPRHRDHPARAPDLRDDRRRPAAAGGRLAGQGDRAAVPAAAADDVPRDRRHEPADRGRVPQPLHRLDQEGVPAPRAQDLPFAVGDGADDVRQVHRRRRRRRQRAGRARGRLARAEQHRRQARRVLRRGADRRARPRVAARSASAASWASTPPASGRKRASRASGPRS